ncbi:hypothetical protein F5Y16DRAFT_183376 [Xylariaceae sp. FL0255]|nr:hypothetical protein F5Y16DRAFT_183376 [Xylariaceae sp. FL0255]
MPLGKWRFSRSRGKSSISTAETLTPGSSTPPTPTTPSTPTSGMGITTTVTATEPSRGRSLTSKKSSSSTSSSSDSSSRSWSSWLKRPPKPNNPAIITRSDPAFARLHKPFTEQNLEHQKLLAAFEWNSEKSSRRRRDSWVSSVSPCASPRMSASFDYSREATTTAAAVGLRDEMLPPSGN